MGAPFGSAGAAFVGLPLGGTTQVGRNGLPWPWLNGGERTARPDRPRLFSVPVPGLWQAVVLSGLVPGDYAKCGALGTGRGPTVICPNEAPAEATLGLRRPRRGSARSCSSRSGFNGSARWCGGACKCRPKNSPRELHGVIQVAMGWEGTHLYQFRLRALRYGSSELAAAHLM